MNSEIISQLHKFRSALKAISYMDYINLDKCALIAKNTLILNPCKCGEDDCPFRLCSCGVPTCNWDTHKELSMLSADEAVSDEAK